MSIYTPLFVDPPKIVDSELVTPLEVLINDTITIDCEVKGIPQPAVTWLSNGQPLPSNSPNWRYVGALSLQILIIDDLWLLYNLLYLCLDIW